MKLRAVLPACLVSFTLAAIGYFGFLLLPAGLITAQQSFALGIALAALVAPYLLSHFVFPAEDKPQARHSGQKGDQLALTTLYVGNLPYSANEVAVNELFAQYGRVFSVRLMKDRETGRRRGFGFIEMLDADARRAISRLNGSSYLDRTLKVREANQRKNSPSQAA